MNLTVGSPRQLLATLLLLLLPALGCSREEEGHEGVYETRIAFLAFATANRSQTSDCKIPLGIHAIETPLRIESSASGDFVTFQDCRIQGVLAHDRFTAKDAPCGALVGEAQARFPFWTYEEVVIDFEQQTLSMRSASLGAGSAGQCNQVEGHFRRAGEAWLPAGDQFWLTEGLFEVRTEGFRGSGLLNSYVQQRPNGELYLLGFGCTLSPAGGSAGAGSKGEMECADRFHGAHGIPKFYPESFSFTETSFSLSGEFRGDRTYRFALEDALVVPDPR